MTRTKLNGKKIHIPCKVIEDQIPDWLTHIGIEPNLIPAIRNAYQIKIKQVTWDDRDVKIKNFNRKLAQLRDEEARLGRLLIANRISDETYDQLRKEWQDNIQRVKLDIAELERDSVIHLDDLDIALFLMSKLTTLYGRLGEKDQAKLLHILVKRIIVNEQGKIIEQQLNSPFTYLRNLAKELQPKNSTTRGSTQIFVGAHETENRSTDDVERFLSSIRFENREKLGELGLDV